ncbi:MAG TPA: thioredoxin domain-containing protein [Terriglobales bacterium]|jgi:protein-disulfide isomerase
MKILFFAAVLSMTAGAFAQATPTHTPAQALPTNVTQQQVDAFLERMYGFDPTIKWRILEIKPVGNTGVTEAVYNLGADPRSTHLYILPDGKNAVAGQILPFGANPFADIRAKLATSTTGMAKGPADAKIAMVVFSDLQCPHCKNSEPIVEKLQQDVPGVKLVFQQFPIAQIHPWAMQAAKYSDCVGRQNPDKGFAFNDAVFAAQDQITVENATAKLNEAATAQGVNAAQIAACAATPETEKRVNDSIQLGDSLEVSATPTLFINGRKLAGFSDVPYETLKQLVEFEVQHAGH